MTKKNNRLQSQKARHMNSNGGKYRKSDRKDGETSRAARRRRKRAGLT